MTNELCEHCWAQLFIAQPGASLYHTNMQTYRLYNRNVFAYYILRYNHKVHKKSEINPNST